MVTAFVSNLFDRKEYRSKASQHGFLARVQGLGPAGPVELARRRRCTRTRGHRTAHCVPCRGAGRATCKAQSVHYSNGGRSSGSLVNGQPQRLAPTAGAEAPTASS